VPIATLRIGASRLLLASTWGDLEGRDLTRHPGVEVEEDVVDRAVHLGEGVQADRERGAVDAVLGDVPVLAGDHTVDGRQ
jgi:hypothetical protein